MKLTKIFKNINISLLSLMLAFMMLSVLMPLHFTQATSYPCVPEGQCVELVDKNNKRIADWHEYTESMANECPENTGRCILKSTGVKLNVPIPGLKGGDKVYNIDSYISILFSWLLSVGGVVAAAVIVWGGYIYITAAGNQARVSQAKETITGGLIGLALLFGSYTILKFLNNRLVTTAPIYVDAITPEALNLKFCNDETPKPEGGVTCGKTAKDSTGANCISKHCDPDNKNICVPFTSTIGLGLSGSANGYACIPYEVEALQDLCEDLYNINDFSDCNYINEALTRLGTSWQGCGFGVKLKYDTLDKPELSNNTKICILGSRLDSSDRLNCSECQLLSGDNPDLIPGKVTNGEFTRLPKSENYFRLFCADEGISQVIFDNSVWNWGNDLYYVGAICVKGVDRKPHIRVAELNISI